ncbi:MAG: carbon-nitrogen hydrolase [Desulfovibrionales bacterium]
MKRFTIGLIQMAPETTRMQSLDKAAGMVREAADKGSELVCLPELFATPYFCQTEDHGRFELAEPLDGPTISTMSKVARDKGITLAVSFFEKRAPGIYHNTMAVIGPDGTMLDLYRKMHIPDDPGYYEKFYFTPGDLGFKAVPTPVGPVGTLVCWDQWFPEAARMTALSGAMVLVYPTAIGWHPREKEEFGAEQRDAWITIQRAHAIANGVYVAAINRVGHEHSPEGGEGIEFLGSSFVSGPFGTVLIQGSTDGEEILLAEIDPAKIEATRQGWPFLRDRRIDAYSPLLSRFLT